MVPNLLALLVKNKPIFFPFYLARELWRHIYENLKTVSLEHDLVDHLVDHFLNHKQIWRLFLWLWLLTNKIKNKFCHFRGVFLNFGSNLWTWRKLHNLYNIRLLWSHSIGAKKKNFKKSRKIWWTHDINCNKLTGEYVK